MADAVRQPAARAFPGLTAHTRARASAGRRHALALDSPAAGRPRPARPRSPTAPTAAQHASGGHAPPPRALAAIAAALAAALDGRS